jgi:outer membrane protein
MTKSRSQFIAITTVLSLALLESSARAQEDRNHVIVGLGAGYAPAYEGADKYRVLPIPAIDVQWGPFFANLRNGVGINIIDTKFVTLGTSVMFMPGYRREDAPEGIGKLSNSAGGRAFLSLQAGGLVATVGGTRGVVGDSMGTVADVNLSYPIAATLRLTLIPSIGTTWADAKYNNRYFGVNAEQSFASGLPQFAPGNGLKDVSALLSANYRLTDHLNLGLSAGATTLLNKVKDSPIVAHENAQPTGFFSVSYRFGS